MNDFIYHVPTRVYFGKNHLNRLGRELSKLGSRVLLCYGGGSIKKTGLYDRVVSEIQAYGLTLFELSGIEPNPRVSSVNAGADICKKEEIDVILAVGGGSVIDCAKMISASAFYEGDAWDVVLNSRLSKKALPIVTVLTLAATGSEMDAGAVISNPETQDKVAQFFSSSIPKVSFLDPTNTYSVSAFQTACGAADILSHILETYFTPEPDLWMLDAVMEALMKTVIKFTPVAISEPENYEARANLMWASSWAINGFVSGGKTHAWSCHPMEHGLSAIYDIAHGLGLAILTPRWMAYTLNERTAPRFRQLAVNVLGVDPSLPDMAAAQEGITRMGHFLFDTLRLQSTLTQLGIDDTHFALMAQKACACGPIQGYTTLTAQDVEKIYAMCL